MKDCKNVDVYVCCASTPVIEDSVNIRFGAYTAWCGEDVVTSASADSLRERLCAALKLKAGADDTAALLSKRLNESYVAVDDFTWLRSSPSPHWSLLSADAVKRLANDEVPMPAADAPEACTPL